MSNNQIMILYKKTNLKLIINVMNNYDIFYQYF